MAKAKNGNKVTVHYTGKFEDGKVFDTSLDGQPLSFELGNGHVIQGFNDAVVGMEPGESKTVTISPDKAYGDYKKELVIKIEKSKLPPDADPQIGQKLSANHSGNDTKINFTIVEIEDDVLTLDANHVLSGRNLVFDIELVEVSS
ncbi:MAG: peptidylprolyl isomerase [Thermodesulfobacteriota bacterium]